MGKTNTKYQVLLQLFPDFPMCKLQFYVKVFPREPSIGKTSLKARYSVTRTRITAVERTAASYKYSSTPGTSTWCSCTKFSIVDQGYMYDTAVLQLY